MRSAFNYQDPAAQSLPTLLRLLDCGGKRCQRACELGNRSPHFGTNPREPAVRAQPPDLVAMRLSLVVELIADSRVFNLNCREADVAFRLARPTASAMGVMARRIGTLAHRQLSRFLASGCGRNSWPYGDQARGMSDRHLARVQERSFA